MKRKTLMLAIMCALIGMSMFATFAEAYSVNPAKWKFYLRDEYEMRPITMGLKIRNDGNDTIDIRVGQIDPEYYYEGYVGLPDKSWVSFEQTSFSIPGESEVIVPVTINIPEKYTNESGWEISNYNQSFEIWILVDQTGPGMFQYDYKCRWMVDTPIRYVPPFERLSFTMPTGIIAIAILLIVVYYARRSMKGIKKHIMKSSKKEKRGSIKRGN